MTTLTDEVAAMDALADAIHNLGKDDADPAGRYIEVNSDQIAEELIERLAEYSYRVSLIPEDAAP